MVRVRRVIISRSYDLPSALEMHNKERVPVQDLIELMADVFVYEEKICARFWCLPFRSLVLFVLLPVTLAASSTFGSEYITHIPRRREAPVTSEADIIALAQRNHLFLRLVSRYCEGIFDWEAEEEVHALTDGTRELFKGRCHVGEVIFASGKVV